MIVWIIDAEQWPRAMLRAELIERGCDAVGFVTVADTSGTIATRFPDVIVVDLRGVDREDAAKLFEPGVPVIAIVSIPEPEWLRAFPWARVMRRPVAIGEIAAAAMQA